MRDPDHVYQAPIRTTRGYHHDEAPAWGDDFSTTTWAIIATLVAVGTCLIMTVVYAAVSHAIHPDCASVLACVRL